MSYDLKMFFKNSILKNQINKCWTFYYYRSFIGSLKRNKNLLVGLPAMSAPVQRSEDNNSNSGGNSANAGGNGNKSRSSSLQQKVKRIYLWALLLK